MCGIVGYLGPANGVAPVLEGLTRLEYRCYDSAGICFVKNNSLEFIKKKGKLDNLKAAVKEANVNSSKVIGHTRWATHGKVTDLNAHPHVNETVGLVHNGIIENSSELRDMLEKEGVKFQSETDTEAFLHLVTKIYRETNDFKKAVIQSFKQVRGNSAFVIVNKDDNKIYSIKRSAPLTCGLSKATSEVFASSDPYALVGFADEIFFPADEVLCELTSDSSGAQVIFYDLELNPSSNYKVQEQKINLDSVNKGNFEHYMLKEIFEQPKLISNVLEYYRSYQSEKMRSLADFKPSHVNISACGTAYYAGLVIKNFLEENNNLKVSTELASEFRYKKNVFGDNELGLFISQSGETADTLAAAELCKNSGLKLFSIVNVEGSALFRLSDENFLIHAGVEVGVASTKAFTQQVLVGYLLSKALKGEFEDKSIDNEFEILASRIEDILNRKDEIFAMAEQIHQKKGYMFTGRGKYYPIAYEGALKLKEIAYVHAEGYASGELKHGPIALIDEQMVNVAVLGPELLEKAVSNVETIKARRGIICSFAPKGDENIKEISDFIFELNYEGLPNLSPIYFNVALQLLSYYIAKIKGNDIDKPRNLAKSVTVE